MKYFLFILSSLFYLSSFAQYVPPQNNYNVNVKVKEEKTMSDRVDASTQRTMNAIAASQANAAALEQAQAARSAAMSDVNIEIKVPLKVNFAEYTHIAIVDVVDTSGSRHKNNYKRAKEGLLSSPLTILSPLDDKKKFKRNSFYLRDIKNPQWIYLYYSSSAIGVDSNIVIILRNYKNEIIYKAQYTNVNYLEVLNELANMI